MNLIIWLRKLIYKINSNSLSNIYTMPEYNFNQLKANLVDAKNILDKILLEIPIIRGESN